MRATLAETGSADNAKVVRKGATAELQSGVLPDAARPAWIRDEVSARAPIDTVPERSRAVTVRGKPLRKLNTPLRRQPPGTRRAGARGASDDDATASGSSPHTSICACSGYCAMIHWCSARTA